MFRYILKSALLASGLGLPIHYFNESGLVVEQTFSSSQTGEVSSTESLLNGYMPPEASHSPSAVDSQLGTNSIVSNLEGDVAHLEAMRLQLESETVRLEHTIHEQDQRISRIRELCVELRTLLTSDMNAGAFPIRWQGRLYSESQLRRQLRLFLTEKLAMERNLQELIDLRTQLFEQRDGCCARATTIQGRIPSVPGLQTLNKLNALRLDGFHQLERLKARLKNPHWAESNRDPVRSQSQLPLSTKRSE